jgi:hypothetical protein
MKINWKLRFGLLLLCVSIIMYAVNYLVFHNIEHLEESTLFYLAYMPLEVIFITLILDQLMEMRERHERLEKMNMVIGVFFSEIGTNLLRYFSKCDVNIDTICNELVVSSKWTDQQFVETSKKLKKYNYSVDVKQMDMDNLKKFLVSKRSSMVQLMENPTLLEHETFTESLRAVFHLVEELDSRPSMQDLPASDYAHLSGDMKRAYTQLVSEWLDYMKYLKNKYPYLYSLSMRTNPFDKDASPIVK